MNVLLHICCAPCSVAVIDALKSEGVDLTGLFYNPNIHPVTEYRLRRDCLVEYAKKIGLPLILDDTYGLRPFLQKVGTDFFGRCGKCYEMRLNETARVAAERGFDAFTTTLLVSPYQNQDLIHATAQFAAKQYGVTYLPRDFRPVFSEGQTRAQTLGLYRQKYCGCIFSEEERYRKKQLERERNQKDHP